MVDEARLNKKGFAIINLTVRPSIAAETYLRACRSESVCYQHSKNSQDLRIIVMGVKFNSNSMFEFDIEGNGLDLIHRHSCLL